MRRRAQVASALALLSSPFSPCNENAPLAAATAPRSSARGNKRNAFLQATAQTQQHGQAEFLAELLENYSSSAAAQKEALKTEFKKQQESLTEQKALAKNEKTKEVLAELGSAEFKTYAKSLLTLQKIETTTSSLEKVLGASMFGGNQRSCSDVSCGKNAICTQTTKGAQCVCNVGFIGDGVHCRTPSSYVAKQLLEDGALGESEKIADLHVSAFYDEGGDGADVGDGASATTLRLVLTYRNMDRKNRGFLLLGTVEAGGAVAWSIPERFSKDAAYGARAVGWSRSGKIAVAWRDKNVNGRCMLRAGLIDASVARDHVAWSKQGAADVCPQTKNGIGADQLAAVALADDKLVLLHKDADEGGVEFGNAVLGDLKDPEKGAKVVGRFRFSETGVDKIEVSRISNSSFVLEYAGEDAADEADPSKVVHREAVLTYGEVDEDALLFDPHSKSLEPERSMDLWSRGVAASGSDLAFASYYSARMRKVFVASIGLDQKTRKMRELAKAEVPYEGMAQLVTTVTVPYAYDGSGAKKKKRTVTAYYRQDEEKTFVHTCDQNGDGSLDNCKDGIAIRGAIKEMTAIGVGAGKIMLVYVKQNGGIAFFQQFGVF